ncbi:MAG: hypothetical protein RL014_2377 [Pseudomonadota bacterium]|jgi:Fe2+ or Zn2+ uptake regulation protein
MERKTRQHQAIYDVIVGAHRPLLAHEVLALATEVVPRLSLATVYRNIKTLQDEGSIKAVVLPGQKRLFTGSMKPIDILKRHLPFVPVMPESMPHWAQSQSIKVITSKPSSTIQSLRR